MDGTSTWDLYTPRRRSLVRIADAARRIVQDDALRDAIRLLHRHAGIVVERAGAAGLAALLSSRENFSGTNVATVIAGGNPMPTAKENA